MADFVAVIRRAVDGLVNNTPEMRVKVYDKARSAVVRQLESMKPRPPEALFQRQLAKLDEAIAEVEAEHAEALSDHEPEPVVAPAPAVHEVAPVAAPVEPAPAPEAPVVHEPAPVVAEEPFHHAPEPVEQAPAVSSTEERDPWLHPESHAVEHAPEAPAEVAPDVAPAYEPEAEQQAPVDMYEPASEPHEVPERFEEPPAYSDVAETIEHVEAGYGDDLPEDAAVEPAPEDYVPAPASEETFHVEPETAHHQTSDEAVHSASVEPEFAHPAFEAPELPVFEPVPPEEPVAPASNSEWEWPSSGAIELPTEPVVPASVNAVPSPESIIDDFDAYLEGRDTKTAQPAAAASNGGGKDAKDAWGDFEALIGYEGEAPAKSAPKAEEKPAANVAADTVLTGGEEKLAAETAYPYRAVPKPRPSIAKIGLAALAVLLLAGGGYALWLNRDSLTNLFAGPSVPSGTPVVATGNGTQTPDDATKHTETPAAKTEDGAATTKFTQRLNADGTEVDSGPAVAQVAGASGQAGQSVAEQNVAPQNTAPAGTDAKAPAAVAGEKMYLYEERLGQSTPTAIEGSVVWDMREEKDDNGKPVAAVQGTVTVPGRNLTALVTFKRNTDPSLPASHLVEIVFSIPADFDGGAIESVQRISMKNTEQDRGNALIAVPARITDDFHMIALNDFPDARATNIELLKNRDWIDIPVTYRNGRHALLTMEKGRTGAEAFNKAIAQWAKAEETAPKP